MDGAHLYLNALEALERTLELLAEKDKELQELYAQYNELLQGRDVTPGQTPEADPAQLGQSLVIESEAVNRIAIAHHMMRSGLKVRTAADGIEAVEALARGKYEVIVFDYMTPRVQPMDFLLVMAKRRPDAAIIVMTAGQPTPLLRDDLLQAGAKLVLAKPFDYGRLTTLVKQFMPKAAAA